MFNSSDSLIKVAKIAPNIHLNYIYSGTIDGDKQYLALSSSQRKTDTFYADDLVLDLIRQIDGQRTTKSVIKALLKKGYSEDNIKLRLNALISSDIIISADYKMCDKKASFWLDLGIKPGYVEHKFKLQHFYFINHSKSNKATILLKKAMSYLGLQVTTKPSDKAVSVVVVDDYLQTELKALSQKLYTQAKKWLLVSVTGITPMLGPIFAHHTDSFCYECLYKRIRNNRQIENIMGRYIEKAEIINPTFCDEEAMRSCAYQFALAIARYVVMGYSKISNHIQCFDWHRHQTSYHKVMQLPQCVQCGSALLASRSITPFEFDEVSTTLETSGGYKIVSPEKTLARYGHLVSSISGVVSHLNLISKPEDDWIHVYESGNNLAMQADNIHLALASVRMLNAGKGTTKIQAKASALAESIERYCSAFQGDEIRKRARFIDFAADEVILPNTFMHYSKKQYENANLTNSKMSTFHHTPQVIDKNEYYEWSPIWSLLEQKTCWVPTQLLYFGYPYGNKWIASADTNGTASGNSKTEAFVQAFLELIERDNVAIWWHNRLQYCAVDLSSFENNYIRQVQKIYKERYQRKLWVIDITTDNDIPTFVAVSHYTGEDDYQEVCFSSAAHFDANIAMLRTICEHNQLWVLIRNNRLNKEYHELSHEFAYWLKSARVDKDGFCYLNPSNEPLKKFSDYTDYRHLSLNVQRQKCLDIVKKNNWQIFISDLTRVDIAMPVVKVMIPQLRSMHTRLDTGRLYEVPVKMGKLKKTYTEDELNPVTIFV